MKPTLEAARELACIARRDNSCNTTSQALYIVEAELSRLEALASPQVTDEQISAIWNESMLKAKDVGDEVQIFARALLSAPPAAGARTCGDFGEVGKGPSLPDGAVEAMLAAASQEAKPVAAEQSAAFDSLRWLLNMAENKPGSHVGILLDRHFTSDGETTVRDHLEWLWKNRHQPAAAPQEQAPADKDATKGGAA